MGLFNRRKDFSQQFPKTPIIPGVLSVVDTPSIDLSYNASTQVLQADLQPIIATGTYGSSTMIPVFTINQYGQITSITQVAVSGGGGGSYSVNNGLTENPANNFQLGGTLLQDTNIDTDTFRLNLFGTNAIIQSVINNGTGIGGYFESQSSNAISALGKGAKAAGNFLTLGAEGIRSTNRVNGVSSEPVGIFTRLLASGSTSVGVGAHLDIQLPRTSSLIGHDGTRLLTKYSSILGSLYDATFELWTTTSNSLSRKLQVLSDGKVIFDKYGLGTFSGTIAYGLAVDSSGNIIEYTLPSIPTVGTWGTLNYPNWVSGTPFVKMTGVGTFALDTTVYTPQTRQVSTQHSITGGGDLSADRTLSLVNDTASPGINKVYGTDSSGNRGWKNDPPITALYPYQLKNYYRTYFPYSMTLYNNSVLHVCYNASGTTGGNQSIDVNTTDSLNTVTFATGMYNQLVTITGSDEIWATSVGVTTIQRLVASTGAFIANTAITGGLTSSAGTRFIQSSASKVFIANSTNIVSCNSSYVTTGLVAHGLGSIPYFAVNNNGSSAQNDRVMIVGTNGLALVNGTTNAITVAATTLSGAIGSCVDVIYDSTNDKWILLTTIGGNPRIVYLTPATATTFTVFETITEFTSFGTSLTPGNALPGKLLIDTARNYLFVITAGAIQQYVLTTGAFIKSLNYRVAATTTVSSAAIDTTNRQLYVNSASSNAVIITQFQYE